MRRKQLGEKSLGAVPLHDAAEAKGSGHCSPVQKRLPILLLLAAFVFC